MGPYGTKGYEILVWLPSKSEVDWKFNYWVWFKVRLRPQWGMEEIILAILCINTLFLVWQTRILGIALQKTARQLDASFAQALQAVVADLPIGDFEPPNPVMQAIANAIGGNMAPPGQIKEISRSDDGKFA
tara:strand:- start:138 stop:530 length:393 start_codon:yes stop_codon:yes gene_type:complete